MPILGIFLNKEQIIQADMGDGATAVAVRLKCPESDTGTMTLFPAEPIKVPPAGPFAAFKDMFYLPLDNSETKHRVHVTAGGEYCVKEYTSARIFSFQNYEAVKDNP
jgi:hypothetical protein